LILKVLFGPQLHQTLTNTPKRKSAESAPKPFIAAPARLMFGKGLRSRANQIEQTKPKMGIAPSK
jgi:hypothetical protein